MGGVRTDTDSLFIFRNPKEKRMSGNIRENGVSAGKKNFGGRSRISQRLRKPLSRFFETFRRTNLIFPPGPNFFLTAERDPISYSIPSCTSNLLSREKGFFFFFLSIWEIGGRCPAKNKKKASSFEQVGLYVGRCTGSEAHPTCFFMYS